MSTNPEPSGEAARGIRARTAEIVVAVILFVFGGLVVYDSHRLGSSWGADGPEAGYFPFYIGAIICVSALVILWQALFGRVSRSQAIFVEWKALLQVLSILVPALVYVLAIQILGLYIASALYIAAFMIWLGKYSWLKSVLLGVAVSAVAFVTFEVWFQVPLYKGAFDLLSFLGY
jgi:hypothetical protein